ncbi:MAG TPA: pyridoxamine 5'-phosphate oxidase family protein [Burkholderiales bacterium]|nr:pyridoxamine 5'-phosphate oxidase family protein [Burkholderiales bacterium]
MSHRFADIAFTSAVKAVQEQYRSRPQNERLQQAGAPHDALGDAEAAFIAERDSFYMATVSETGWPYVQHRGGPPGFLKVLGPKQLAFADFRGNTQLISAGNAASNDRVSLILMDYRHRQRLKILGRIRFEDASRADAQIVKAVQLPDYRSRVERLGVIEVEAFDWNCPQHITPRFTEAEVRSAVQPLHERIAELEAKLASIGALAP